MAYERTSTQLILEKTDSVLRDDVLLVLADEDRNEPNADPKADTAADVIIFVLNGCSSRILLYAFSNSEGDVGMFGLLDNPVGVYCSLQCSSTVDNTVPVLSLLILISILGRWSSDALRFLGLRVSSERPGRGPAAVAWRQGKWRLVMARQKVLFRLKRGISTATLANLLPTRTYYCKIDDTAIWQKTERTIQSWQYQIKVQWSPFTKY